MGTQDTHRKKYIEQIAIFMKYAVKVPIVATGGRKQNTASASFPTHTSFFSQESPLL